MSITKVSSKGQLVIPKNLRKKLEIRKGDVFATVSVKDTLIFKKVKNPLNDEDIKTVKLVEEAWDDVEKGRFRKLSKKDFLNELDKW